MPSNIVKKYAEQTGKEVSEVEKLWKKAKAVAEGEGRKEKDKDFYPYVVGILKNMLSINESHITFEEFYEATKIAKEEPSEEEEDSE